MSEPEIARFSSAAFFAKAVRFCGTPACSGFRLAEIALNAPAATPLAESITPANEGDFAIASTLFFMPLNGPSIPSPRPLAKLPPAISLMTPSTAPPTPPNAAPGLPKDFTASNVLPNPLLVAARTMPPICDAVSAPDIAPADCNDDWACVNVLLNV